MVQTARIHPLQVRFFIFLAFIVLCFLGGGGSRGDIMSLLYLRPAAVICMAAMLLVPGPVEWRSVRVPLMLLGALALLMIVQLIPLPPEIWTGLPGRGPFVEVAQVAGIEQPWRPLSITPDLTLNSLAALLIPLAALVGYAAIGPAQRQWLLPTLVAGALVSALFAIGQLAGGPGSRFYLYDITNLGSGVGLFANRNHQGMFLATIFPLLAAWALLPRRDGDAGGHRLLIAALVGAFLVSMILATGSRAGLILGGVGILFSYLQFANHRPRRIRTVRGRWGRLLLFAPLILGAALLLLAILFARADALDRLLAEDPLADAARTQNIPLYLQMIRDMFPFGSGFGSFAPIFQVYEPFEVLDISYLNQAHNDLVEIAITGGLPALLILGGFILWWSWRSISVWRNQARFSTGIIFSRLGSMLILLLLLGSLADYPLRTPILSMVFAIACAWLASPRSTDNIGEIRGRRK
jgi:hypothetical protein